MNKAKKQARIYDLKSLDQFPSGLGVIQYQWWIKLTPDQKKMYENILSKQDVKNSKLIPKEMYETKFYSKQGDSDNGKIS